MSNVYLKDQSRITVNRIATVIPVSRELLDDYIPWPPEVLNCYFARNFFSARPKLLPTPLLVVR